MHRLALFVLAFAALALADPTPRTDVVLRTGKAYCTETGKHLYTEHHTQQWQGTRQLSSRVLYKTPDGKLLASKDLSYRAKHQARPAFRFEDVRTGLVEQARWRRGKIELRARETKEEDFETAELDAESRLVVDAGFDHAVLENWAMLVKGEKLAFRFAVPAKLDWYSVAVQKTGIVTREGRKLLRLSMDLDSVLGWFTTEVILHYDLKDKFLVEYKGISNILDADGDTQDTRIVFDAPRRQPAKR